MANIFFGNCDISLLDDYDDYGLLRSLICI